MVVEDLFFNTPARLKYMKSLHTELGHITELLNRFALSHPNIRFEVFHNGNQLFRTTGSGDMLQAISNVYGMKVARQMLPVANTSLDFTLKGYIGKPELTRASRNYITMIINGRYIKNYRLTQAIAQGYHTMLPIGRHPIVVLAIDMDPVLVDVNVHPSKLQVRFSKEKELEALVQETIKQTLQKTNLIPEMQHTPREKPRSVQPQFVFEETKRHSFEKEEPEDPASSLNDTSSHKEPIQTNKTDIEYAWEPESKTPQEKPHTWPEPTVQAHEESEVKDAQRVPPMYPIGQLHGTYILAENDNGLYMIDQHAAQERIKYEHFKKQLGKPENELQDLLIPLTFDFSGQEKIFIDNNRSKLEAIGLYFEEFGPQSYVIRSHPNWFPKGQEESIIRDMVEQIMQKDMMDIETIREEAAIMMSCKRSIKANHHLNITDMTHLLESLRKAENPYTCPHGRPVIIHFTSYELEKMFKRVM
ncbi:DNA mismatch repair protein HexB [Lentibacillus sp. JNUCC-1]|nr:DNA mismatch repair protein HexB [Lentibacillus sp. JNUCC-1]